MLATGGAGQVYPNTTNPFVATGDGIAMAYRANAAVANMEFIQFHPTALFAAGAPIPGVSGGQTFLITEALRGEGGILRNLGGDRFMSKYDAERMELAPRDVVARAIQDQMRTRNEPHVWLDISHLPAHEVLEHFPNIAERCATHGIDITTAAIPVVPAQHYTCGGVQTGLLGETSIQGLYACGEVACSGLHGANRLASNSLLEGLVFADRAVNSSVAHAEHANQSCCTQVAAATAAAPGGDGMPVRAPNPEVEAWAAAQRAGLNETMWQRCGIVRRTAELRDALDSVKALRVEVEAIARLCVPYTCVLELRNLVTCAELIITCALQRKESRGLHYNLDFPQLSEAECHASVVSLGTRQLPGALVPAGVASGNSGGSSTGSVVGGGVLSNLVPAGTVSGVKKRRAAVAARGEVTVRSVNDVA